MRFTATLLSRAFSLASRAEKEHGIGSPESPKAPQSPSVHKAKARANLAARSRCILLEPAPMARIPRDERTSCQCCQGQSPSIPCKDSWALGCVCPPPRYHKQDPIHGLEPWPDWPMAVPARGGTPYLVHHQYAERSRRTWELVERVTQSVGSLRWPMAAMATNGQRKRQRQCPVWSRFGVGLG
jgi:hypothetical protein